MIQPNSSSVVGIRIYFKERKVSAIKNLEFITALKTWSSLRAVSPTGRKLGQVRVH
jgi:hypothetical protein